MGFFRRDFPFIAFCRLGGALLGLFSTALIADKLGAGWAVDLLFIAQIFPVLAIGQLRNCINVSFVPLFSEKLKTQGENCAWREASNIINTTLVLAVAIAFLYSLLLFYSRGLLLDRYPRDIELFWKLSFILSPIIVFFPLFALGESLLYSYKKFPLLGIAPWMVSGGTLFGTLFLSGRFGVMGVAWGISLGYFLQAALTFPLFWSHRRDYLRSFNLLDPTLKDFGRNLLPVSYMAFLFFLSENLVSRFLAASLGEGRVSALVYAFKLLSFVPCFFTSSLVLPTLSATTERLMDGGVADLKRVFFRECALVCCSTIPLMLGIILWRKPLTGMLFERGSFTPEDTQLTASVFAFLAPTMLSVSLMVLMMQKFWAMRENKVLIWAGTLEFCINVLASLFLMKILDVAGIALGTTIASYVQSLFLFACLRHHFYRIEADKKLSYPLREVGMMRQGGPF